MVEQECRARPHAVAGERLKRLRNLLGYNQEELAGMSGGTVARTELNKYERGWHEATGSRKRVGLASALGLSLDDLHKLVDGSLSPEVAMGRSTRRPKQAS